MSTSEPRRSRVARPCSSRSNTTRWPWRSMRKMEPTSAVGESSYSVRSTSRRITPANVVGSYDFTTPCMRGKRSEWSLSRRSRPGYRSAVGGLGHLAGADARRAHVQAAGAAVDDRPHPLDVRIPPTLRATVRVGDAHTERRLLAAHLTHRCHDVLPLQQSFGNRGRLASGPMEALERLAAEHLKAVVTGYRDALRGHQEAINRLNVYPVPDGDTGTNMALTLESVVAEVEGAADMVAVCRAISHGSLMGARGNSGVILSQILRGVAKTFEQVDAGDGQVMADALSAAAEAAYGAVMRPVEGTILTVARAAGEGAQAAVS